MDDQLLLRVLKIPLILAAGSFMALTAVSFFRVRLKKKEREFQRIVEIFQIDEQVAGLHGPSIEHEYSASDYLLPVTFSTAISLAGFAFFFFAGDLLAINPDKRDPLLTGLFETSVGELRWDSGLVLVLAFLGAFLWSAQNILRRLVTADLTPGTYYGAGLRMVVAPLVALVLSWLLRSTPGTDFTLPAVALLTGMIPERALAYLEKKTRIFTRQAARQAHPMPLEMIEGVSPFHAVRLHEVGIDNAQNLSEASLIELLLKTPFPPRGLIDWIAQAWLYVEFKDDVVKLRAGGVRTILDLASLDDQEIEHLAEETAVSAVKLRLVARRVADSDHAARLRDYRRLLSSYASTASRE